MSDGLDTKMVAVDGGRPEREPLERAAAVLRAGGLVAFPTETVYGLGADALNEAAVQAVFEAKGRPADNPLIVHIASREDVERVASPESEAAARLERLAGRFWPGPLTVVVRKAAGVPDVVTGGLDTVAVRMPGHPVALALIRAAGRPLAAPSANRSGRPSPTEAAHVWDDLAGRVDMILDGGPTAIGVESTVVELGGEGAVVHRLGAVSVEQLAAALGEPVIEAGGGAASPSQPVSPGTKYEHYAPRTPCVVVAGSPRAVEAALRRAATDQRRAGRKVGLWATKEGAAALASVADALCVVGSRDDLAAVARNMYRCLRRLDDGRVDVIFIEGVPAVGLGAALMNRLGRAAGHRVVTAGEERDTDR